MTLGEKIAKLRMEHRLSQGDLAEKLDVSRQSISKWETGSSIPDLDKLVTLSELVDVSLDMSEEHVLNDRMTELSCRLDILVTEYGRMKERRK